MGRGQELSGFTVVNDAVGLVYDKSRLIRDLAQVVDTSTSGGDWRVRSIACRLDATAPASECSTSLVVFGYVDGGQLVSTSVLMFELHLPGGAESGFLIEQITNAFAIWRQDTDILLNGGALSTTPAHSSTFDFGPFHRWSPP